MFCQLPTVSVIQHMENVHKMTHNPKGDLILATVVLGREQSNLSNNNEIILLLKSEWFCYRINQDIVKRIDIVTPGHLDNYEQKNLEVFPDSLLYVFIRSIADRTRASV